MKFKTALKNVVAAVTAASLLLTELPFADFKVFAEKIESEGHIQWNVEVSDEIKKYASSQDKEDAKEKDEKTVRDSLSEIEAEGEAEDISVTGNAAAGALEGALSAGKGNASIQSEITASGEENGFSYDIYKNLYAVITKYEGNAAKLVIPDKLGGKDVSEIGGGVFQNHAEITEVVFPDCLKAIGYSAFKGCSVLKDPVFNDGLTAIGDSAFEGCCLIEKANLPDSVTSIGYHAFYDCSNLSYFKYPKTWTEASGGIFGECPKLTSIEIPEGAAAIPSGAFRNTEALAKVKFPSTLTKIGDSAFKGCTVLTDPVFNSGLTAVGDSAFEGCYSIEKANLPDSVTSIGYHAFYDCSNLSYFKYPKSWAEADSGIFGKCPKLTSIEIPEGAAAIPSGAFRNTEALAKVTFPSTLTKIGDSAFKGCSVLTDPVFNSGLTAIGGSAFEGCYSIEKANLPDSVTSIGYHAFYDCSNLSYFKYPKSWTEADSGIFGKCPKLTSIEIPEGAAAIPSGAFRNTEALAKVAFPSTLTKIGDSAFKGCSVLTDPVFNSGLTAIGGSAFEGCYSIEKANLPDSVTSIGYHAFYDCSNLSYFKYPKSWAEADSGIFGKCPKLTSIEIPEGAAAIPSGAFRNTEALAKVTFPSTLTKIGDSAFKGCSVLTDPVFNDGLTAIGDYAFESCNSIENINLPDSVTSVGHSAFYDCTNIVSAVLSEGLTAIYSLAFAGCTSLNTVNLPKRLERIGDNIFDGCPLKSVYCPDNSKSAVYAIDNDLPMVLTPFEGEKPEDSLIDYEKSGYKTSFSSITASGNLAVVCDFQFEDNNSPYSTIKVKIPDGYELIENALSTEGCYEYDISENDSCICIYADSGKGRVSAVFKPVRSCIPVTYATISYNNTEDVLGIICEEVPALTVNTDSLTNKPEITVTGVAPPKSEVTLFVNDKQVGTAMSNKAGYYIAKITIPDPENGKKYTVTAKSLSSETKTASALIEYAEDSPVLTGMKMIYNKSTYDLMNSKNINVTFILESFHGVTPFRFELAFENPESVCAAFVTSTRNGITKYLEAKWDETGEIFVAEGYFDENDHDYVPGKLSIAFQKNRETGFDFDEVSSQVEEELEKGLPDGQLSDVKCTYTAEDEIITIDLNKNPELMQYLNWGNQTNTRLGANAGIQSIEARIKKEVFNVDVNSSHYLNEYKYNNYKIVVKTADKVLNDGIDFVDLFTGADDFYSYFVDTSDKKYIANLNFSNLGTWAMVVDDVVNNKVIQAYIEYNTLGIAKPFFDSTAFSIVGDACGYISDQFDIHDDYEELAKNIRKSTLLTESQKQEALKQAQYLGVARHMFSTCMLAAKVAGAFAGPLSLPISIGLGLIENFGDMLFEMQAADILDGSFSAKMNWYVDPSGYVYEAVTSNRLQDVKATAYWIPLDPDDPDFWNKKPDGLPEGNEKAEIWNAEEYSQPNPIYTDADGMYAWDTPEGWWIVKYEKEGYETAYSDWMPVPPPQLEVNIAMTSKEAPRVTEVVKTDNSITVKFSKYIDPKTSENIEVYDANGNKIAYVLEYSDAEISADGAVYVREVTLKFAGGTDSVIKVVIPKTVLSYSGTETKEHTEIYGSSQIKLGDVNGDGKLSAVDAKWVLQAVSGSRLLTPEQQAAADVNGDGKINAVDAKWILQAVSGSRVLD